MKIIIIALSCVILTESAQPEPFGGFDNSIVFNENQEGSYKSLLFDQILTGSFEGGPFDRLRPKCADKSKPTCVCADGTIITRSVKTY